MGREGGHCAVELPGNGILAKGLVRVPGGVAEPEESERWGQGNATPSVVGQLGHGTHGCPLGLLLEVCEGRAAALEEVLEVFLPSLAAG